MDITLKIPKDIKAIQEAFLLHQTDFLHVQRPVQAWQWMTQTRSLPDHDEWVRADVLAAWKRCLHDYQLPLGNFSNWEHKITFPGGAHEDNIDANHIATNIQRLSQNFHTFLSEANITMVVAAPSGHELYSLGSRIILDSFLPRLKAKPDHWLESVLGNNGIGSALTLKKPIAFQGMEHYLSLMHPYTTVGYPLLNEEGKLLAVIGLISSHQETMNSLFAFLHLICVLLRTNLPLTRSQNAQARILQHINFSKAKSASEVSATTIVTEELQGDIQKAVNLQHYKVPILITGESGVGKDHFVKLIKQAGPRKDAPLIAINCASIPHDLIESELFGYEAGSFTGARSKGKPGKFLLADKGILFLDEIGDMCFELQSTLLRVLESSEFTPVGGSYAVKVDVQVVAATNVKLLEAVEQGRFRRDLYYRLNGAQIHLPPLRQREDKKQIVHHFLQRELEQLTHLEGVQISHDVISLLEQHPWPGNIRQLINVIRATLYTSGNPIITLHDLPLDFLDEIKEIKTGPEGRHKTPPLIESTAAMSLEEWEIHGIKTALHHCGGNITQAAKTLGITRTTLYKKMDRLKLNRPGKNNAYAY